MGTASKVPADPNMSAEVRDFLDTTVKAADQATSDLVVALAAIAALPALATQAEAEAGTDNVKYLSALRVAQAIAALTTAPAFTLSYVSTPQTITSAGALTLAHGMGVVPKLMFVTLKNTTAELGYSIDDLTIPQTVASSVVPDATNLNVRFVSGSFVVWHKTTGVVTAATNASWNAIFSAYA